MRQIVDIFPFFLSSFFKSSKLSAISIDLSGCECEVLPAPYIANHAEPDFILLTNARDVVGPDRLLRPRDALVSFASQVRTSQQ